MNVFWYMCAPDGAYPWQPEGSRQVDYGYYKQLAQAYDHLGYTGALFATGAHDVWVLASALLAHTERLRFLVAIHPGLVAPTLLAKMAATFQEFAPRPAADQCRLRRRQDARRLWDDVTA